MLNKKFNSDWNCFLFCLLIKSGAFYSFIIREGLKKIGQTWGLGLGIGDWGLGIGIGDLDWGLGLRIGIWDRDWGLAIGIGD